MSWMRTIVVMLAVICAGAAAAEAQQPVQSLDDLWQRVASGDRVFVTDGSGRETSGVFAKVSPASVSLLVDGQLRDIPAADVRRIAKRGDSLMNGFLIGAAIGAPLEAAAFIDCDSRQEDCLHPAAAAVVGALFFGGVGTLVDYFIKGRTVVFSASSGAVHVQPALSILPGQVSASLTLSKK